MNSKTVTYVLMLVTLIGFQNCGSEVQFETFNDPSVNAAQGGDLDAPQSEDSQPSVPPVIPPTEGGTDSDISYKVVKEQLDLAYTTSKELDIVWVIDNSGSMKLEAEHVRNNYFKFIESISDFAQIKSALISYSSNSGTGVKLPSGLDTDRHKQINAYVSSSAALCYAQTSLYSSEEIDSGTLGACSSKLSLSLNDFLRPTSQKIFVFVTDDNSQGADKESFLQSFKNTFGQNPIVYSFIGLGSTVSKCQARTGTHYRDLSEATGGEVYNICDEDWSEHFSNLTNHVAKQVESKFSLKHSKIEAVVSVKVNNTLLEADQFSVEKGLLTIDPALLENGATHVTIEYTVVDETK